MTAPFENAQVNQRGRALNTLTPNFTFKDFEKNVAAEITLLENGMILGCNNAGAHLLGATPSKLIWQHIARLLPQLSDIALILDKKVNPYLSFLSSIGHRFEVIGMNGVSNSCELFFSVLDEFDRHCLRITLQPANEAQMD